MQGRPRLNFPEKARQSFPRLQIKILAWCASGRRSKDKSIHLEASERQLEKRRNRLTREERRQRRERKKKQREEAKMGICASAETRAEGNSASKYRSEEKISSNDSARSRTNSGANVTERKIENALAAQHRKKKARMVVTDRGGVDAQDPNFECPHFPKSATQTAFLTSALSENFFMFPELEQENQSDMVGAMKEMTVNAGEQLMKQGDQGDKMYVVESGNFDILVDGQIVSTAGKKKVIGELALVYQVGLVQDWNTLDLFASCCFFLYITD